MRAATTARIHGVLLAHRGWGPRWSPSIRRIHLSRAGYGRSQHAKYFHVSHAGQSFFLLQSDEQPSKPITQIVVVQNWFAELERMVPAR